MPAKAFNKAMNSDLGKASSFSLTQKSRHFPQTGYGGVMERNMKTILTTATIALFIACNAMSEENVNSYRNNIIGFEIEKPQQWHFMSKSRILDIKADAKMTDKELQEEVAKYATTPIVVITKHNPPTMDNPTVTVVYKPIAPLEGWSPDKVLGVYASDTKTRVPNVKILVEPEVRSINGMQVGYMEIKYPKNMGEVIRDPITARTIMIPQGKYMYLINMFSINDAPEFQSIIASIAVKNKNGTP